MTRLNNISGRIESLPGHTIYHDDHLKSQEKQVIAVKIVLYYIGVAAITVKNGLVM